MKKKVLIFGSNGQLGFDLTRVFRQDYNVAISNRESADVASAAAVSKIIVREKPNIIINATAYNKVEAAETDREQAFNVNAKGAGNLAHAAEKISAVFVHVSSDYVFDGSKEFFTEEDQPNPLNAYGASKLAGEELVKSSGAKFYLIRTSSVFGVKQSKQKVNFIDQMVVKAKQGQVLKVVKDQIMCPTYSLDLAGKVKELLEKPAPFGTYHITNLGSCSWYEFTVKILELMNLKTQILPITSQESGSKVNRPKRSVLKDTKLTNAGIAVMPPWQDALRRYLAERYSS
jgi:dTDP-4-dehydrorhamnose reductase